MLASRYFFIKLASRKKKLAKSSLSDQELRVLNLIAEGLSNKEIAEQLFITSGRKTVCMCKVQLD